MSRLSLILLLAFSTVGCDQTTKHIARETLQGRSGFSFFGDLIRFQHAENPGAFLSFGANLGPVARFWIFTGLVLVFLTWASYKLLRDRSMTRMMTIGWTLVVAGGFGNVIDRMLRGTVTDFVMVGVGPVRTGVFNVADMAIMGGIALLLFFNREPAKAEPPSAPAP